jgi:hypothetical protein
MYMEQLETMNRKLDVIIRLLAYKSIEGKNFDDKIVILSNLGFDNKVISEIIGAKPTTVKTRKSQLKTKKK